MKGRMHSDALEQRMSEIKNFLRNCLDCRKEEKEIAIPTGEKIKVPSTTVLLDPYSSRINGCRYLCGHPGVFPALQ